MQNTTIHLIIYVIVQPLIRQAEGIRQSGSIAVRCHAGVYHAVSRATAVAVKKNN